MSLEFFLSSNLQDGETALHAACVRGHDSVVKLLIDANADLGIANKVSMTKPMAFITAKIQMQHIDALCNACTDRYASYGKSSLHSSFSITTSPPPPLPSTNGGSRGGARERAHPRLRKFCNVQTIFKHVSMCVRNLLGACIDASAAVQRLCPYMPCACVASTRRHVHFTCSLTGHSMACVCSTVYVASWMTHVSRVR